MYMYICSFIIYDLSSEGSYGQYLISMNISVCYEASAACDTVITVFENTLLPKTLCDWNKDFKDPGTVLSACCTMWKVIDCDINR